jgi:hypothetical protein
LALSGSALLPETICRITSARFPIVRRDQRGHLARTEVGRPVGAGLNDVPGRGEEDRHVAGYLFGFAREDEDEMLLVWHGLTPDCFLLVVAGAASGRPGTRSCVRSDGLACCRGLAADGDRSRGTAGTGCAAGTGMGEGLPGRVTAGFRRRQPRGAGRGASSPARCRRPALLLAA